MYRVRYQRIIIFFAIIITSLLFWDVLLPRLGLRQWSARRKSARMQGYAVRFRRLAIQMGGVMIKVGQFLSSRVDILPREVTAELAGLQDEVPAVPFAQIKQVIEAEFGGTIEQFFAAFDPNPLAAASLGQVHCARLRLKSPPTNNTSPNGMAPPANLQDVVVKVQRPNIENLINTDLRALKTVGRWLQRYRPIKKRANVPLLLDEFARILYEEIDYLAEGRNAETFASNFKDDPRIRVPAVIWSFTTQRVLTLENVLAVKITDYQGITTRGLSRAEVASRLLDTYLKQIFEDGFFHADPHPGNLFVNPNVKFNPHLHTDDAGQKHQAEVSTTIAPSWQLTFVDFGMVGHVPPTLRTNLREVLIGVGTKDSARCMRAYQQMGILLPGADLEMLDRAQSKLFDEYWGKNMSELSNLTMTDFRQFADEFRELLFDLPFQIPQDLIYLARTVNILSGMCTGLDPQFNVFAHLAPFAQKLISEEARNNRGVWVDELKTIATGWLRMPIRLETLLSKLERGEISMRTPELSQQVNRIERSVRQITIAIIFTGLLLGGIQLLLAGQTTPGWVLLGVAALCIPGIIFTRLIKR